MDRFAWFCFGFFCGCVACVAFAFVWLFWT
jgi:hypothetical protein